jgi:hypothetical protein
MDMREKYFEGAKQYETRSISESVAQKQAVSSLLPHSMHGPVAFYK